MQMERISLRGTSEVAGLQTGTNCYNYPRKLYEGKGTWGNQVTNAKIIIFMYKEESFA